MEIGEAVGTSNLAPEICNQVEGTGASVNTNKLAAESGYHNPDALVWLLGHANEVMVVVEGVEMMGLVNNGSQIYGLTEEFCTGMGLRILPLRNLIGGVLCLEVMGAFQYCTKDM